MTALEQLIAYFEKFPGVGGRQAKRFAYHVLTLPEADSHELTSLITAAKQASATCLSCYRYFSRAANSADTMSLCAICSHSNRDHTKLLVVASDNDINAIEKSGLYDGLYFVLGGTVPLLHSEEQKRLRGGTLKGIIEARLDAGLTEVILGFAVNPDGENTARFVESIIRSIDHTSLPRISQLGRGLSTGSELEYADPETIKSALLNRA